ncbi:MAG: type I-G CRISPR-associated helicase/endonuclease Cas3g [Pseudonocardiaceae bacterium]
MTEQLDVDDFADFFRTVHAAEGRRGPDPFPWQRRLVRHVADTGSWPTLLDLPTGSGKTAALDAAVFLLALLGDQPRRMVFVVDRRIVVHQAAQRTEHLARRLHEARDGVLRAVAQRLRELAGLEDDQKDDQPPLEYAELRGGIVRDDEWARRPDVPTVVVSTVDQVGSRLLFRGYGVSRGMRPVHAGLLGNDVLYLLDEVHLARPFAATLEAIHRHYRPPVSAGLPERWSVVELSATPAAGRQESATLRLGTDDRDPGTAPVLARRLAATKRARTQLVKVSGTDAAKHRAALAVTAAEQACALLEQPGVRTVGVVVNRVDTASRIHSLLAEGQWESVLLTGRMRPLDRDRLLADYEGRLMTGRRRGDDCPPLVLVATQAIEAGADIDLDALVTECAPLDSLVQRFGRVDRDGYQSERGYSTTSVVLATTADVMEKADDPVYGDRLRRTWTYLQGRALDFGIEALDVPPGTRSELSSPSAVAPHLMPSHLDRWVQTSVTPDADPDPAHWMHGLRTVQPEVTVVWRADVLDGALADTAASEGSAEVARQRVTAVVSVCPPASSEAMQLPVAVVRAWLASLHAGQAVQSSLADTEGATVVADAEPGSRSSSPSIAPALRWQGDESTVIRTAADVRPGSTIVVPATYGGIEADNWNPTARGPVSDLGVTAQATQHGRAVLRLYPTLAVGEVAVPRPSPWPDIDDRMRDRDVVTAWLDEVAAGLPVDAEPSFRQVVTALRDRRVPRDVLRVDIGSTTERDGSGEMFVVRSRGRVAELHGSRRSRGGDSEPATSSFLGAPVALTQHLSDVERWAQRLALNSGLPAALAGDLALAGRLHDLGKVDPRFQLILRGGEVTADVEPLAKSVIPATDFRQRRRAEEAAGYPHRARHELATIALVERDEELRAQATDWELVLHLVASHHGYARPFVPVSIDPSPHLLSASCDGRLLEASSDHGLLSLDSGVPQRFWTCIRRYGWYGLAWLEAILRLADHRASEQRSTAGEGR